MMNEFQNSFTTGLSSKSGIKYSSPKTHHSFNLLLHHLVKYMWHLWTHSCHRPGLVFCITMYMSHWQYQLVHLANIIRNTQIPVYIWVLNWGSLQHW